MMTSDFSCHCLFSKHSHLIKRTTNTNTNDHWWTRIRSCIINNFHHKIFNTFDSISFTVKDDSQAQRKALELAVADAQGKAEVIAAAAGRELGGILTISQGSEDDYSYYNSTAGSGMYMREDSEMDGAATTVRAAQIRVNAQVQISYELK